MTLVKTNTNFKKDKRIERIEGAKKKKKKIRNGEEEQKSKNIVKKTCI